MTGLSGDLVDDAVAAADELRAGRGQGIDLHAVGELIDALAAALRSGDQIPGDICSVLRMVSASVLGDPQPWWDPDTRDDDWRLPLTLDERTDPR